MTKRSDSSEPRILPRWIVTYPIHFLVALQCIVMPLYLVMEAFKNPDVPFHEVLPKRGVFYLISRIMPDHTYMLILFVLGIVLLYAIIRMNRTMMRYVMSPIAIMMSFLLVSSVMGIFISKLSSFSLIFMIPSIFQVFLANAIEGD